MLIASINLPVLPTSAYLPPMKKLFLLGAALLGLCAFGSAAHAGGDDYEDYTPRQRVYEGRPVYRERVVVDDYCPPPVYVRPCPPPPPVVYGGYYGPRPYRYGYGYRHRHYYHRPVVSFGVGF